MGGGTGTAVFKDSVVPVKFEIAGGATGDEGGVEGSAVSDAASSVPWAELKALPVFDEALELEVEFVGAAETAVINHKPKPALTSTRPSNEQNLIKIPPPNLLKN